MSERRPDVANVFWDPAETLRCLHCDSPILPRDFADGTSTFLIWFTSNEDSGVYCREVPKDAMPGFCFYKFCCEDCCRQFTQRAGPVVDHTRVAHQALNKARELPASKFVLGGLSMGMPIEDAISIINCATGTNYRSRMHGECKVFSATSNIDYPNNAVVLRSLPLEDHPVVEFRLHANVLHTLLQAYEPDAALEGGILLYLRERVPLFHAPGVALGGRSRWMVGFPERGVRLYACIHQADEGLVSLPEGSVVAVDLKRPAP